MCGFAGWFDLAPGAPPPPPDARRRALDALSARGPDGEGATIAPDGAWGLLHRRLVIVDLAGGAQPFAGPGRAQHLAWNGELFDHVARRAELEAQGETFATRSDTEVLARLLARRGAAAIDTLRAQYALAWVDGDTLVLARDPAGEKPLYWRRDGSRVLFASTLAALDALAPFPRKLDRTALSLYLSWGFVPAPRTAFLAVSKLRAGDVLSVTRGGEIEVTRRAAPGTPDLPKGEEMAALRAALAEASRLRLESADVPVGLFLSAGLDSLAVAAVLRERADLRTFTVRSRDPADDESAGAAAAALALGVRHEVIDPPEEDLATWRAALRRHGEPFGVASAVAVDAIARAARPHVKVVLTGDGGDEALGGYPRHQLLRRVARLPRLPRVALPGHGSALRRIRRALELASLDPADRYAAMYETFGAWRARVVPGDDGSAARALVREVWADADAADFAAMLRVDRTFELPDAHCAKVDVACMGNGVEPRSPWLDSAVIATCDALPERLRVHGRTTKVALRELLRRELPERAAAEILARPKRGFAPGFDEALRSPQVREFLLGGALDRVPGLRMEGVRELLDDHVRDVAGGPGRHRFRLFHLVGLAVFAEEWLA